MAPDTICAFLPSAASVIALLSHVRVRPLKAVIYLKTVSARLREFQHTKISAIFAQLTSPFRGLFVWMWSLAAMRFFPSNLVNAFRLILLLSTLVRHSRKLRCDQEYFLLVGR